VTNPSKRPPTSPIDIIATDMLEDLESTLDQLRNIVVDLEE
jgi:hypothetical protein